MDFCDHTARFRGVAAGSRDAISLAPGFASMRGNQTLLYQGSNTKEDQDEMQVPMLWRLIDRIRRQGLYVPDILTILGGASKSLLEKLQALHLAAITEADLWPVGGIASYLFYRYGSAFCFLSRFAGP